MADNDHVNVHLFFTEHNISECSEAGGHPLRAKGRGNTNPMIADFRVFYLIEGCVVWLTKFSQILRLCDRGTETKG